MSKYYFSSHSKKALATCDYRLREIANRAIKEYDFSVVCGYRNEADQNYAYDNGFSKVRWPNGKHNSLPSRAMDLAPYPINWKDAVKFTELSIIIKRIADELGVRLRCGIDWGWDLGHYELDEP